MPGVLTMIGCQTNYPYLLCSHKLSWFVCGQTEGFGGFQMTKCQRVGNQGPKGLHSGEVRHAQWGEEGLLYDVKQDFTDIGLGEKKVPHFSFLQHSVK